MAYSANNRREVECLCVEWQGCKICPKNSYKIRGWQSTEISQRRSLYIVWITKSWVHSTKYGYINSVPCLTTKSCKDVIALTCNSVFLDWASRLRHLIRSSTRVSLLLTVSNFWTKNGIAELLAKIVSIVIKKKKN